MARTNLITTISHMTITDRYVQREFYQKIYVIILGLSHTCVIIPMESYVVANSSGGKLLHSNY